MHEFNPTVLVVEDEEGIRALIVTILRLAGFDALQCADTAEAQDLMAMHGGFIRLLITDVNLGSDLSGIELARNLRGAYPSLKVLYVSGLVDEGQVAMEVHAGLAEFLPKPFTPKTLSDKVAGTMAGHRRLMPGKAAV